jgi:choline dehydrogenase-like flavoprotein
VPAQSYDIITVGGGIGASALAKVMAERGAKVLVLEKEQRFKDRVRGEGLVPWGVAEARELGILELLRASCGHEVPLVEGGMGPRDLTSTTPQRLPCLSFAHQEMQETRCCGDRGSASSPWDHRGPDRTGIASHGRCGWR